MGYTFKNAKEDFFNYLGISPESVTYVPNSKDFGIELVNPDTDEKCVVFISAVGRNTSSPKMYFDTRDSYPKERIVTRNYARENNLKFFFLGVRNEEDCKIKDFFISLEANESQIQSNSGKVSVSSTERGGNQVNLPSTFTYTKKTERLKSDKGFFFSAIHKEKLWDYMTYFDNRPYEEDKLEENVQMNEENKESLNRIIFGAPGTGKSHKLDAESSSFLNQEQAEDDIEKIINNDINIASNGARKLNALNALGFTYADYLKNISKSDLAEKYSNVQSIGELYVGSRAKEIAEQLVVDADADDYDEKLTEEIEKAKNGKLMIINLNAIGYKYSDYLCEKTLNQLKTDYNLTSDAQMWWLYRGAQAGQLVEKKEIKQNIKFLERVTFHPNYSYSQFVGTYKPMKSKLNQEEITYEYVPGPFMRVYVNAKRNPEKKFLLLIEEINRANVAAVFGDVFQLLDRKNDGTSQYPISASEDQKNYLDSCGINEDEIAIPSNMYIWATMNSADQGVLPMDAAFKRRWDFEYLDVDNEDAVHQIKDIEIPISRDGKKTVKWNEFRTQLNDKLSDIGVNEDKLLGPFFMSKKSLENATAEPDKFVDLFESKVIMYLFEDVVKMQPGKLFTTGTRRYSRICKEFEEKGMELFGLDVEVTEVQ